MCLAVPGQIQSLLESKDAPTTARVVFGGMTTDVSLAFTPEANVGDYVIVHAGCAIALLDQAEALETLEAFRALGEGATQADPP
ncbi:MAG: HypC/HybG/HupF family hydrogenase formation chaperone [Gammaproteobacteria bacterium]|nr:HypC/HybG/HupF family hydrogenase formation chaperone [Gammaproteobacteria bacterium]NBY21693.1 HypC/HybG/HupF family hydrogenase formation chaperone [Gammaproteobacteria bacterium]NDE35456.1 HypC/HybG/HupF family hydrogenase formation chaperone [Gammaproteobacteria bacterium]